MTKCRNCATDDLAVVLSLGEQPLANAYLDEVDLARPEPRYPLALGLCPACGLAQLTETVAPEQLFTQYPYFSSVSDAFVDHAGRLVDRVVAERGLDASSLAMEIGSNDGYLLRHYVERGVPVLGVDPAANIAQAANEAGVPTVATFFGADVAEELRTAGHRADVIHANNVIAHVPDIHGVIEGISRLLTDDGVAIIETPYVRDMVERVEFDTIYHEHVFYYSLRSIDSILRAHGLRVVDVERIPVHGGSLRIVVAHQSSGQLTSGAVTDLRTEEDRLGLGTIARFEVFAQRVEAVGTALRAMLADLRAEGHRIAAYGAAAKGTVLLNAFRIGPETLEFVADRSPHKQGRFMPGVHIPIVAAEQLAVRAPGVCLVLAWNFIDEIMEQQQAYRQDGGRFLLPAPEVRFLDEAA